VGHVAQPRKSIESPRRRCQRIGRERACIHQLERLPRPGEELLLILDGRWHGWDLVGAVLELAQQNLERLDVATLGFNRSQTIHLVRMLDAGRIRHATMLVSEVFREKDRDDYALLHAQLTTRGHVVAATRNHAKLLLFTFADGSTLTAHGSLNLRRCNAFEQLAITPDPHVHDFFLAYIQEQTRAQAQG
jgi:hypothetical protein